MFLETVETEGLAQLSYVVGDKRAGVCAVVDPRRDVEAYLETARRRSARIVAVLETHIHADFVSGGRALSARTGAVLHGGRSEAYGFDLRELEDGDRIELGDVVLQVLHTPGHSPEHLCYVASGGGGAEAPWGVFTGDTLFAGSVGRPDLSAGTPKEELARRLWRSLRDKLLPLGDGLIVYPGHGAGSPCGSTIGDRRTTTLGYERRHSEKLAASSEEDFVGRVLGDLPEEPSYYRRMKALNAEGPPVTGPPEAVPALDPDAFRARVDEGAVVVDGREIEAFAAAHLEGSLNIPLRPSFPVWAGWMLHPDRSVLLVLPAEDDIETARRHLFRIGVDRVAGYLRNGMRGWFEAGLAYAAGHLMDVHQLRKRLGEQEDLQLLDVRSAAEFEAGRIPGAIHQYAPHVAELADGAGGLDPDRPVVVYCGSGYRSSLAASVLRRVGFRRVFNVPGSMDAWRKMAYTLARGEAEDEKLDTRRR